MMVQDATTLLLLRSYRTIIETLGVVVALLNKQQAYRKDDEEQMKHIEKKLGQLSRDVSLMRQGGVPDNASLRLLANDQKAAVDELKRWADAHGPKQINPGETVQLRQIAKKLESISERLLGHQQAAETGEDHEPVEERKADYDLNDSETAKEFGMDIPTDDYRSSGMIGDVPKPEDAAKEEVAEIVPPAEGAEDQIHQSQPRGFHQKKVAKQGVIK
jgi:hypothetical protein